jgi:DNA-binding response OmpR family regulator
MAERRAASAPARRSHGEMVLLVEADPAIRDLAESVLRREGYKVQAAANADEATDWSTSSGVRPQLLVAGLELPGLSGPNLAARLLQQHPHLRLLYLSDRAEDATEIDGRSWAIPTLAKPFTSEQLAVYARYALDAAAGQV